MLYIVKWNNGYHKVFNTLQYTDVQLCGLFTEAKAIAQRLNNRG